MSIFRVEHKDQPWLMITKPTVEDERLSFRALGALTWLLNKPDDWRFTAESMARGEGREGRDAIRKALRELEEHGYIHREKFQDEHGRWATTTIVYEESPGPENPQPKTDYQPSVDQPSVDQALLQGLIPRTDTCSATASPKRTSRAPHPIPDEFRVGDDGWEWASEHAPSVDARLATKRFVSYWRANGKQKKNWHQAWRNWLLNDEARSTGTPAAAAPQATRTYL